MLLGMIFVLHKNVGVTTFRFVLQENCLYSLVGITGMYGSIIQKIYMKDQIKLPFILKLVRFVSIA